MASGTCGKLGDKGALAVYALSGCSDFCRVSCIEVAAERERE